MRVSETQKRVLSFILAFLMMFSTIHPVFANVVPDPEEKLEVSDELIEPEKLEVSDELIEPEKLSIPEFNKLSANKEEFPSDLDGSKIETIVTEWITEDSVEDNDKDSLNQVWTDNSNQLIRMRINYALSGQHDYPEGSVNIEIPKNIVRDRNGKFTGTMTLAVPQAPDKSGLFSYVDNGDTYILTNTKKLPAATSGMFEVSIRDLKPSDIEDKVTGYVTDEFKATISVNTKEDNIIQKTSNSLTANFDTFAKISGAYKNAPYNPTDVYPFNFPSELKPENSDKYAYVAYDVHAYSEANQPFSVSIKDNSSMNVKGDVIVLGYEDTRTGKITKGNGINILDLGIVDSEYLSNGQNFFGKVYVAYSKDNMESGVRYKLSNNIEYTMTALDDKEVTTSSAASTKEFMLLKFEAPTGHFFVEKYGKGPYNFALNLLKEGKEVDTEYRVYTKGFGYKWTRPLEEDADYINSYGKVDYSMITTDYETRLFSTQDKILDNEDFYFKKLRIDEPSVYDYGKYEKNGRGYYEDNDNTISYGPISQGYYGYIQTKDYSKYPDMKVSVSKDGTNFTEYATFSYKTGKPVFTKTDGSVINGNTIEFPQNTIDYKVELTTKAAAVLYDMYPTVTLKPSKYVKENLDKLFKETDTPNTYGLNKAKLDTVLYDIPTPINAMQDDVVLNSFQYGSRLIKSLRYDGTSETQKKKQNVRLSYSSTFTSQTNLQNKEDLQTVIREGLYKEEKAQTWYDLLPRGVVPDTNTIKVSNGKVLDVEVIENYRGSGRIMLVVKTETEPKYSYTLRRDSILGQDGYKNDITLSFDANYSWMDLADYGDTLNNLISYESANDVIGNTTGLKGEPDDPSKGFNKYSKTAIKDGDIELMTDLNKDHDNKSFVYANAETKLVVDTYSLTSIHKQVDVNGEGVYGDGLDNILAKNVYENGRYSYRLRMKNTSLASSKNIKFYDSLENYVPTEDKADFGDTQWRGQFLSIDVSQLKEKGINPVVYYSTKSGLVLADTDNRKDLDLSNKDIWSTQAPTDKSKITAIAIDASKDLNGNDYELPVDDSISAFIHMKSPKVRDLETDASKYDLYYDTELGVDEKEAGLTGGAHAYNNVSSTHVSIAKDNGKESDELLVRHDYVKVGLKPYNIEVKKEFNDDDNRDGIRDKEVTIRLLANGVKTEHTITLNEANNFTGKFTNIEYLDGNAKPINYTLVEENTNEKYQFKIKNIKDSEDGKVFEVENYHEPERISIKGIKTWQDDDLDVRPEAIKLALYGNGKLVQTKEISADASGNWNYSFDNLFKYENGKEIEYKVKELDIAHGYYVEETEDGLVNKYYPYGDVKLSKEVTNKTDKTNKQEFTFTFYAKNKTTGEYDTSKYEYVKSNGETGTIMTGSEFTLKDGEEIHIKDILIDYEVSFKEKELPGYKLTSDLETDVKIKEASELKAVNEYSTKVSVPIKGTKTLEGRGLESYQFIFDIYDEDGKIIRSGSNRKDGDILFGSLEYSYEDLEKGTFNYTIRERQTDLKGYIIDEHVEKFSVTLKDNGDGTITATPKFDKDGIVFSNKYEAKGDVNLIAYKRSATKFEDEDEDDKEIPSGANDKLMNEYLFDFELVDKETGKVVSKGQNDKNGKITFDKLGFNQDDIGKTFVYLAREIKGNYEDVIYDETQIEYTVKVSDNGDGTLSFDVVTKDLFTEDLGNEENVPTFGNKFKPGKLEVSKFITNGDPSIEFKFKIKFNGEEHLIPSGEFELNRKDVDSPYKVVYEDSAGKASDNVYLYDKEGEYEIKLPGEGKFWTTVDGKLYKSGDSVKYTVNDKGNVTFEDNNITVDNEGNINFKAHIPGRVLVKVEEINGEKVLTIYPEDGVVGTSKDQEFHWGEDNPYGTEKKGAMLTRKNSSSPYLPTEVNKVKTEGEILLEGSLSSMFIGSQATSLDLSSFDTSNVTSMGRMFYQSQATSLDLSKFDTSNVTDMISMFYQSQATSIDLSSFDTSKVTDMSWMFYRSKATSLDLSNFDTSKVTNMKNMFMNSSATSLDLSSFDTSKVTNMSDMFYYSKATSLILRDEAQEDKFVNDGGLKTAGKTITYKNSQNSLLDSTRNFANNSVNLFRSNTSKAASPTVLESGTDGGVTWEVSGNELVFRPTNGVEGTFNDMYSTSPKPWNDYEVDLVRFEKGVKGNTNLSYMFNKSNAKAIDTTNFDTSKVTDMEGMFAWSQATSLGLSSFDTSKVTNMRSMFYESQATSLDLSNFNTSNVTSMFAMFYESQATSLNLSSFDTSNVTDMIYMFYNSQATSLDLSSFDTSKVTDMSSMFGNSKFEELILSNKFNSLSGTELPNKDKTEATTGKWIRDDKVFGPWTSEEFMQNYTPEKAGRYILEPKSLEYKIIFDSNGNNGSVSPIEAKKGEEVLIPSGNSIYTQTKRFVKWNTEPDGTGTDYIPGDIYKDLSTPGKDITLYAIMEDRDNSLNIKDGEATFTLRHGESITLDNLPKGLSYEIYEESESGWRLVETRNTEGVIESNETHKSTFINAYEAGTTSVQLNARKNLDGLGKEGFTFNLIENGKVIQTKKSQSSGNIQFDPIVYKEPGTHTYTIKEVVGNDKAINYDTHEETVIVKVTEDVKGDLVTEVSYDEDGVVFNNTTKEVELDVTKEVQNTTKQDTFYFDVTINGQTERIELKAGETKKLSGIKINSTYEVKEVNIDKAYEVVGNVSQSGILDKNTDVTITNKYNPTIDFNFNLEAKKNLEGRELKANEFSFIVIDESGKTIAESSNDINGKVEFGLIPVTKLGTSIFKVKELPGNDTNIEYDTVERIIEVTASDTKIEEIKIYEADKEIQELVFNNKYTPEKPGEDPKFGYISITKNVLNETESIKGKEYEVEVSIKDKDNKDIDKEFTYTSDKGLSNVVKNKDVIKIKNGEIITINDLPEGAKVSIKELVPEGFTLLEESKLEDIIVADQTVKLNLENDYTPTGSFRFKGNKLLLGREIKDYRFTFTVIRDGDVLQKVNNDETGDILFEDIVLTKEDIGKTYKYQIVEDDDKQKDIVYDQKVYEIEVSVTDDGKGNIIATYADPEITFTNAHREMPQTGFNYNVYIPALILIMAGLALVYKRKKLV